MHPEAPDSKTVLYPFIRVVDRSEGWGVVSGFADDVTAII